MHALRPERVDRERRDERRVDPAREPEHDVAEAVLADVVAQREHEREPHLLELGREGDDLAAETLSSEPTRSPSSSTAGSCPSSRSRAERAPADVAQPPADRLARVEVDDEQRLLEARRPREDLALVVEHDRVAVEEELVLAADEVAEREVGGVVARARDEHLLAVLRLADVERRRGEVDEQLGAGEREVGRRRARLPDVLADRRPDQRVAEPEQQQLAARREVAVLVEDAVVRQEALAVEALHLAVGADGAGVAEVAVEPGRADERRSARCTLRDLAQRLLGGADEARAEQQVLGRVPGDGELGEEDELRACRARVRQTRRECARGCRPGRRRRR